MNWVILIMLLAVLQSIVFGGMVGWARGKYQVPAPAISGNEIFERYFRVHYNTNEQLLVFLPSLWFFATLVSSTWAAILGAVYLAGRIIYAMGYIRDPKAREIGFTMSLVPTFVLLLGSLYGVIRALLAG